MIRNVEKTPVFSKEHGSIFFEGFDEDGIYGYLAVDLRMPENAIVHLQVFRWSKTILKHLLSDWNIIKDALKRLNVKTVGVTKIGFSDENKKFIKFVKYFGFKNVIEHITITQEL